MHAKEPTIETGRMRLRPLRRGDLSLLLELDSDPEVRRYVDMPRPPTREMALERLPRMLARYGATREPGYWLATSREGRTFYGWFHLRPVEDDLTCWDLGYRLRREVWGRGLATEGAQALVRRAFEQLGAERVLAHALADNRASRRVLEKAGMRLDRSYLHRGVLPAVSYVVTRREFGPGSR